MALGKHEKYTNPPHLFEGRPASMLNSFPPPSPPHSLFQPTNTLLIFLFYDLLYFRTSLKFLSESTLLGVEGTSNIEEKANVLP